MKKPQELDRRGRRIVAWTRTPAGRAHARSSMIALNEKRHLRSKCGAKAKTTGEPCRQVAMANGRCVYHGGGTPSSHTRSGGWHRPRWPKADAPGAEAKLERKLRDLDRAARRRAERLAAMSDEERQRYERWHAVRQPGSSARRAAARLKRKQKAELAAALAAPSSPRSPELEALDTLLDKAKRRAAALENDDLGIFG